MKAAEFRAKNDADLVEAIEEARQELYNLRFQGAAGRLANNARVRIVRRDLARLLTIQRERELWAAFEVATGKKG